MKYIEEEFIEINLKNDINFLKISKACNNKCLFCCDTSFQDGLFINGNKIKEKIIDGKNRGLNKIFFSGGEPTIHPHFLDFLKYSQDLSYKNISVITNGRIFCYDDFCKRAIKNGLNEVILAIHGHNENIHDEIVGVKGAFTQTLKGLENLSRYPNIFVNIIIIVNKINYKYLPKFIRYFSKFRIRSITLMNILPLDRACQHKYLLFYDVEKVLPFIRNSISLAQKYKISIEIRKFPVNYLEGFEYLINDPDDFIKEVIENDRMRKIFSNYVKNDEIMWCYKEWCRWCFFKDFCEKLIEYKEKLDKAKNLNSKKRGQKLIISRVSSSWIMKKKELIKKNIKRINFSVQNYLDLEESKRNYINLGEFFNKIGLKNVKLVNIPKCFYLKSLVINENLILKKDFLTKNKRINIKKFAKHFFLYHYYYKSLRCNSCLYNKACSGMHINYLRTFGFSSLQPLN